MGDHSGKKKKIMKAMGDAGLLKCARFGYGAGVFLVELLLKPNI